MYLEHFHLSCYPFSLTPNTDFYCQLPKHEDIFNFLMVSIQSGEGFIKVTGEVGSGKTLLCRRLLNQLPVQFVSAYIPNPDLTASGLRKAFARELSIEFQQNIDEHGLLELINKKLMDLHAHNKRAVLIIDEAQALTLECLEAVRLLTNLETESDKLLQVVLFGQTELDSVLQKYNLRQLQQRITFATTVKPLSNQEVQGYIAHRLVRAGLPYDNLFSPSAKKLLYRASRGIPRMINILCHKALMVAYGKGDHRITALHIRQAILDTDSSNKFFKKSKWLQYTVTVILAAVFALGFYVILIELIKHFS